MLKMSPGSLRFQRWGGFVSNVDAPPQRSWYAGLGTRSLDLPRRSPDLNVLDYSLWHAINARVTAQEAKTQPTKVETKGESLKRRRRCAMMLPKSTVQPAAVDVRRRLHLIAQAKGSLFEG